MKATAPANQSSISNPSLTQHVDRLHRRAQQTIHQQTQQANRMSQSVSLDQSVNPAHSSSYSGGISRRASDPVRPLDRNFGVIATSRQRPITNDTSATQAPANHSTSAQAAKAAENCHMSHSNGMQQQVGGLTLKKNKISFFL